MASKLSFHPFQDVSVSINRTLKTPLRNPQLLLFPSLNSTVFCSSKLSDSNTVTVATAGGRTAPHAVKEEEIQASTVETQIAESIPSSSKLVLVVGGTGGVGQLVVASLINRNIKSRLLLRDPQKAESLFGEQDESTLKVCQGDTRNPNDLNPSIFEVCQGDTRNPNDLNPSIFEGVTHVICCTGTTAFPSKRWDGDNTPERVDWEGIRNLVSALPWTLERFVLVSSVGVTKYDELPWSIMNLFGVLKFKKMGEDFVRSSGLPYTIIRAGRLTDGPYTSYDLNTLLQATAGERRAVVVGQGDKLVGEVSRLVVAEACIQALDIEFTRGQIYEINSVKLRSFQVLLEGNAIAIGAKTLRMNSLEGNHNLGEGPGCDLEKWKDLFRAAQIQ